MKIIAIGNHKGGVGKTQTTFEFAWWNARLGKKVLVIDTDPQANITKLLLDGNTPRGRAFPDILVSGKPISHDDINTRKIGNNQSIDFIVSNIELSRIEGRIISNVPKEYIMGDVIAPISADYDLILIDMAPSAELLGISTLVASDGVLITTNLDIMSVDGTHSLINLINDVKSEPRLNPKIELLGILVTKYKKTLITIFHGDAIKKHYPEHLIPTYIRESTKVQQATTRGLAIMEYDPTCTSAKDYESVFNELSSKIK